MRNRMFAIPLLVISVCFTLASCSQQQPSAEKTLVEKTAEPQLTTTQVFGVEGMTCTGCEQAISGRLKKMPGVVEVRASHEAGKAWVALADAGSATSEIVQAIEAVGYSCRYIGEATEGLN